METRGAERMEQQMVSSPEPEQSNRTPGQDHPKVSKRRDWNISHVGPKSRHSSLCPQRRLWNTCEKSREPLD